MELLLLLDSTLIILVNYSTYVYRFINLYMHMKDINVKKGQKVKKGQIVGTLGQSGRATGPHLDIRLNWFEIKLDPMTILN